MPRYYTVSDPPHFFYACTHTHTHTLLMCKVDEYCVSDTAHGLIRPDQMIFHELVAASCHVKL